MRDQSPNQDLSPERRVSSAEGKYFGANNQEDGYRKSFQMPQPARMFNDAETK